MIRFTEDGIFADTKEEVEAFYDMANQGDPMIMAHLALYKKELENISQQEVE